MADHVRALRAGAVEHGCRIGGQIAESIRFAADGAIARIAIVENAIVENDAASAGRTNDQSGRVAAVPATSSTLGPSPTTSKAISNAPLRAIVMEPLTLASRKRYPVVSMNPAFIATAFATAFTIIDPSV